VNRSISVCMMAAMAIGCGQRPAKVEPVAEKWTPATEVAQVGDVRVKIESVRLGQAPLISIVSGKTELTEDTHLQIEISVENTSDTRKIDYQPWDNGGEVPRVADEFDNRYKPIEFGSTQPVGHKHESSALYPGKSLTDVFVFEEPVDQAKTLRLTIPARLFGGDGYVRFEIPRSMAKN